jgi:ATP/ADP translocase
MKVRPGRLADTLSTVLLLLVGAALVYGNTMSRELGDVLAKILSLQITGIVLGVLLILSVLFRWINHPGAKKSEFISFNSSAGSVDISVKGYAFLLRASAKSFPP